MSNIDNLRGDTKLKTGRNPGPRGEQITADQN